MIGKEGVRPAALGIARSAEYLGVSVSSVRRRIGDGTIPAVRLGSRILIRVADLDAFLAGGES